MKPITEHLNAARKAVYEREKYKDWQECVFDYETKGLLPALMTKLASETVSILQKEHDSEMEEFAEWIGDNCKKMRHYWEYFGDGPLYTTTELLQLFREREG